MSYFEALAETFGAVVPTTRRHTETCTLTEKVSLEEGMKEFERIARLAHHNGFRLLFLGNGGSAAIASHMAVDYSKNFGIRAQALNDVPTLTALANDCGYEHVFSKQLELYARPGDCVVAISSSGESPNIVTAVERAAEKGFDVVTLSGFKESNRLRNLGRVNFWVPRSEYGLVEIAHLAILHSLVRM